MSTTAPETTHVGLGLLEQALAELKAIAHELETLTGVRDSNASPKKYVNFLAVKGARGRLYGVTGYNAGPAQFLHIFDQATAPIDGASPEIVLPLATLSSFTLDFGLRGRHFVNGIVISNSTTDAQRTLGALNLWLDVQYD